MGSGLGKMIAGGAIGGFGEGLVGRAEHKRKVALQMIEEQARASREAADRTFRSGLIGSTEVAEDGTVYGITAGGERKNLGFKGRKSGLQMREERMRGESGDGAAVDGLSAGDKRLIDAVISRNTTGYLDEEEVDWAAVDKTLREEGRADLADFLKAQDTGPEISVDSPEYKEADRLAREWAKERTGLFSSRESEFPETGGDMAEAINQKRMEIYSQLTGKAAPTAPAQETPAPEAPAQPESGNTQVPGSGSEQDPYRPTTQAQFDNIPAGAVYVNPADGKLYRKN